MFINTLIQILDALVGTFLFLLVARIVLDWLVYLDIITPRHRRLGLFRDAIVMMTEPLLLPFRRLQQRFLPRLPIDLSPIALWAAVRLSWSLILDIIA